jgi:hypothetical protein
VYEQSFAHLNKILLS